MARGHTNGQIAERLGITLDGAKFHVSEIIARLQVTTREEAVEAWRSRRRFRIGFAWPAALSWFAAASGAVALAIGSLVVVAGFTEGSNGGSTLASSQGSAGGTMRTESLAVVSASALPDEPLAKCPDLPPQTVYPDVAPFGPDWVDFVNFNGTHYLALWETNAPNPGPGATIRQPFGRVAREVSKTTFPGGIQDCDAAVLAQGTILYTIDGYDPSFRIATGNGRIYEAFAARNATTGRDLFDLEGKVVAIEIRALEGEGTSVLGRIEDPGSVEAATRHILEAPIRADLSASDGESYLLRFELRDGSAVVRTLDVQSRALLPVLQLPQEAVDLLLTAIE